MESSSNHMRFPLHQFVRGLKIRDSSRWKSSLSSSLGCGVLRNIFLIMNGLEYWEALCSRKSRPQQNVRKPPKCYSEERGMTDFPARKMSKISHCRHHVPMDSWLYEWKFISGLHIWCSPNGKHFQERCFAILVCFRFSSCMFSLRLLMLPLDWK